MNNRKRFIIFLIAWLMPMAMLAQTNHWTPVSAPYEDNMSLTGVIQINGVEQESTALEIGAFCGTECRGSARPVLFNVTGRYVFFLTIFGNNSDQITFKLYDHSQGMELNLQSPAAVTFGPNGLGSPVAPYVLNFTAVNYTISASASPSAGGSVSGAGTYQSGSTCTLTATPNTGYNFVKWTKNGTQVSTNASYSFTVTANASYVAVFSLKSYTVSASASPTAGGSVSGAGTFNHGSTCTLTATANTGYTFTNWTKNGTVVSTNASYSFTVTSNATYVANFSQNTYTYTISASASPSAGGSVSGAGTYQSGSTCTLTATPNTGYNFVKWTKNGTQVSTNASYSFTVTANASYVAVFSLKSYTISASASPSSGGTVSGAGTYNYGSTCTLTATANTGYTFVNWTRDGSVVSNNPSFSITVNANRTYVANFRQNSSYTISASASPSAGGSVSGAGTYQSGSTCTLTATPNTGYNFVKWTKNGTQVSTNASYSFTVTANASYVAVFSQKSYTILASASPTEGGSVSGAGTYTHGSTCTLTATPSTGYEFVNWTRNGSVVSNNPSFSITVNANRTYVANFRLKSYTVSASASPTAGGTVSGAGTYTHGSTCTLTATANTGYTFVNWTKNDGSVVSNNPSFSITVRTNHTYVANFRQNDSYTISASASPTEGGSVSGAGTYQSGSTCTLTATANTGYTFVNWTRNGSVVSNNPSFSITVGANRTYVANFRLKSYTVSASASPTEGGSVSGAGTYTHGSTCTLTATANTGYTFVNWTKNDGSVVSNNPSFSITVRTNHTYVANFRLKSYTISATANPAEGGTVSGAGTYTHGSTCTLTATANTGYTFVNWTRNGSVVSNNPSFSITVNANRTYVANFRLKSYTISASANPAEGGSVSGAGTYTHGSTCTLTATPNTGYKFVNWTRNGSVVSNNPSFSVTVNANRTYVANFRLKSYTVTASADPTTGGSVSGAGTYNWGSTCTLTATANPGYNFVNWTKNGSVVSNNPSFSITVKTNLNYVANFTYNGGGGDHAYVDLGLPSGLLWATCNVGADYPEDYGDYFAWGETETKYTYNWSTYHYCLGSSRTLTKYCNNSGYGYNGFTDNLTTLLLEDDAATANWGDGWRMPTNEEFQELLDNTTVIWTTQNGVNGCLFTASNGNSLFMPAAGYRSSNSLYETGTHGRYWSSSLFTDEPYCAWYLHFNTSNYNMNNYSRSYGRSIRPVRSSVRNQAYSSSSVIQKVELLPGTNWFSTYLDITLEDLKSALVASMPNNNVTITIKSQTQNTKYQNGRWVGQLEVLDLTQMYMITVPEACEITLEGMPIDPTKLSLTITPGVNWIAFPYDETMTVTNFFGSFPINNDVVKSQLQNAKYNNGRGVGQLNTLIPGQGYIYNSAATSNRTFTFPTSAK